MKKRISYLFIMFSLAIIFLVYKGFMPHPPKLIPINADILTGFTMELRANYPQVSKIDLRYLMMF